PTLLHVEPDFWGYAQQRSIDQGGADKVTVKVSAATAPECAAEGDTLAGFGRCLVAMTRARAPNAILGFHASVWGTKMDVAINDNPSLDVAAEAGKSVAFFKSVGAGDSDYIATDVADR